MRCIEANLGIHTIKQVMGGNPFAPLSVVPGNAQPQHLLSQLLMFFIDRFYQYFLLMILLPLVVGPFAAI